MSDAIATDWQPHPCAHLRPGEITWAYCKKAMDRTDHVYQPGKTPPLRCLCEWCNPRKDEQNG